MKLYHNLNVDLTLQNCGSQWLMVLTGKESDIYLAFNGLWNFMATSGELEWLDHTRTSAKFWSSASKMYKYFYNRFAFPHSNKHGKGRGYMTADILARAKVAELQAESTTIFNFNREYDMDSFGVGTSRAERPDSDFRDSVLTYAYKDKTSVKEVEKQLAV